MVNKIISGGQTGADIAGLKFVTLVPYTKVVNHKFRRISEGDIARSIVKF